MGSEEVIPLALKVDSSLASKGSPGKKIQKKVPKRFHKAEREKQKREQLNDLFFELSNAIDTKQLNNGKASVLCEATRLLKDLLSQIEGLRNENTSLLSESHYVSVEKNELKEENSTLETQIRGLQDELAKGALNSNPDLNVPPPSSLEMPSQPHAVFVMPLHSDSASLSRKSTPNLSKPHPRYPTSGDSWLPPLLRKPPTEGQTGIFSPKERDV